MVTNAVCVHLQCTNTLLLSCLRLKCHPFSLSDTCHDKTYCTIKWWTHRPVKKHFIMAGTTNWRSKPSGGCLSELADLIDALWTLRYSRLRSYHSHWLSQSQDAAMFMWYGVSLIPRQGVITAAGGPHAFSRHSAVALTGTWLHQWFINAVWLWFSLRGPKERRRKEKRGWLGTGFCS